jgi:hypothetical protein
VRTFEETVRGRAAREAVAEEIEALFASDWEATRRAAARTLVAVHSILIEALCNAIDTVKNRKYLKPIQTEKRNKNGRGD